MKRVSDGDGRGVTEGDGERGWGRRRIDQSGQACREISSCSGIKAGLADTEDPSRMLNMERTTSG